MEKIRMQIRLKRGYMKPGVNVKLVPAVMQAETVGGRRRRTTSIVNTVSRNYSHINLHRKQFVLTTFV